MLDGSRTGVGPARAPLSRGEGGAGSLGPLGAARWRGAGCRPGERTAARRLDPSRPVGILGRVLDRPRYLPLVWAAACLVGFGLLTLLVTQDRAPLDPVDRAQIEMLRQWRSSRAVPAVPMAA